jgi:hypothetical protein
MGEPGALDDVVNYAARELGWKTRCEVYALLAGAGESRRE